MTLKARPIFLKFSLLFLVSAATILVAWSLEEKALLWSACNLNYWFMAALFGVFAYAAYAILRRHSLRELAGWVWSEKWAFVLLTFLTVFLQVNEPHRPKILYDEDVICSIAFKMHEDRKAVYPARYHYFDGQLRVFNSSVDKRPVFYPFALATVHDLSGYRPSNVFFLNAALTFALLAAVYFWVKPTAGPAGASAAAILLSTLPLLAQSSTGAGFEVMNLFLIAAFLLSGRRYLARDGAEGLDLFICVALMLASTRYESALYLFALCAVVLFKWVREKRVTMTWFSALSPLFMFPSLVCNRVFVSTDGLLQTKTEGAFFSLSYIPDNLAHIVFFLFSPPWEDQTNSLLLSLAGILSLVALAVLTGSVLSKKRKAGPEFPILLPVILVIFATTSISLIDNWGQWDDPMVSRYALPFHLAMVLGFAAVLPFAFRDKPVARWIPLAGAAWLLTCAAPQMSRHEMTNVLPISQEADYLHKWELEHATVRDLFVDQSAIGVMLIGRPAVPYISANAAPWKLKAVMDAGLYENVYVCEKLLLDDKTNQWRPADKTCTPDPSIRLEPVYEFRPRLNVLARISRVTGIDDPKAAEHAAPKDHDAYVKWLYQIMP